MNSLFALIPLGLVLLAMAIAAFFWAVQSGQFDDLETPGTLVLFDEEPPTRVARPAAPSPAKSAPGAGPP